MKAYVVTRENEMGCGIKIYIDPSTALIVGGSAYGGLNIFESSRLT